MYICVMCKNLITVMRKKRHLQQKRILCIYFIEIHIYIVQSVLDGYYDADIYVFIFYI